MEFEEDERDEEYRKLTIQLVHNLTISIENNLWREMHDIIFAKDQTIFESFQEAENLSSTSSSTDQAQRKPAMKASSHLRHMYSENKQVE